MMGAGKSSVGRALAARLGWPFIDSDEEIERAAGRTIAEIFAEHGESEFRRLESRTLAGLPERDTVIALGGGAIGSPENRAVLESKGTLIWLDASIEALVARTSRDASRPLLANLSRSERVARLQALLSERRPAYAQAKLRIATDGQTPQQVAAEISSKLELDLALAPRGGRT